MPDNETSAERHHFVTVNVADRAALRLLAHRGLDLFSSTAKETADGASIEGHLSVAEITDLVDAGHDVRVRATVETPPLEIAPDGDLPRTSGAAAAPAGYQQSYQLMRSVRDAGAALPGTTSVIELPERSAQGTQILALRLRGGTTANRPGVLILGGVHARELANPDILDNFIFRIAYSLSAQMPVNYTNSTYDYSTINMLVNGLDIFIVPLVNPDGRDYVMAAENQRMWRKNRSAIPGSAERGVDLNRNYDFLFSSGIGTSAAPGSEIYRGPYAFSEPETRNIRWLLDTFPHITAALDLHSYSETILYPWGDDDNQTTDPAQNFRTPNPDRGVPNDGRYREYIPSTDLNWLVRAGNRMQGAIAKARGRSYSVQQSVGLYPTTGTVDDYSFSRHFINPALTDVHLFCIETGQGPVNGDVLGAFQPPFDEVMLMRHDLGPAIIEYLLEVYCPSGSDTQLLQSVQAVLERHLAGDGETRDLHDGLLALGPRILATLGENPRARVTATSALKRLVELADRDHDPVLDQQIVTKLGKAATAVAGALPEAKELLESFAELISGAAGKPLSRALASPGLTRPGDH